MRLEQHHALWNKIQDFSIDDGNAVTTFSGKLASSQKWSVSFTLRAIEEYKKFIFLCCISPTGAAPSHTVDEVWHLHLTYTHSYWTSFCKHTLHQDIHHAPSKGGKDEDDKHHDWYAETLVLYEDVFGTAPPEDIWPRPKQKLSGVRWNKAIIVILLLLPFIFILTFFHTIIPFSLKGSEFLLFYPLYSFVIIRCYIIYHKQIKQEIEKMTEDYFPDEVSAFQMASFLHGKARAVQTGIIDLLKRDLIAVGKNQRLVVKNKYHKVLPGETNPLILSLQKEEHGKQISYDGIVRDWYYKGEFTHADLAALYERAYQRVPSYIRYSFPVALLFMALARMVQGLINERPIAFLIFETIICFFAFYSVIMKYSIKTVVQTKAQSLYKERVQNIDNKSAQITPLYALEGAPAIRGFSDAAILIAMFGISNNTSNGWVGGSSCSGGGGCGSSCGGGGCGGCGGGD